MSANTSKLNVLVNKLHEFLAHSAAEDNDTPTENANDLANCRSGHLAGHNTAEAGDHRYSRRKPLVVTKHSGLDESGDSNASEDVDMYNAYGELDMTRLPKGTAVVRPEPVENGRDDFRGPEFCNRKQNVLRKDRRGGVDHIGIVSCTACGRQVNHFQRDSFFRHPVLKVLICKSCYKYYLSDDISKDRDGMDEQCRWCAEGGNLICCDYCSNAFCKKCILRNLGRKELSAILESKWYCYVCNPEPLFNLVISCDNILGNLDHLWQQQRKRNPTGPEKSELFDMLPHLPQNIPLDKWDHTGMDGNVVFNYSVLQTSKEVTKKTKHLVDSTNTLNRIFVNFIHSVTKNKQPPNVRTLYLKSFLSVVKGLRKSLALLEDCLKEEFSDLDILNCWEKLLSEDFQTQTTEADIGDVRCIRDLQNLAAEHLQDNDSDSKDFADGKSSSSSTDSNEEDLTLFSRTTRQRVQKNITKLSDGNINVTRKLVVKLTPMPVETKLPSTSPQRTREMCARAAKKSAENSKTTKQETTIISADSKMCSAMKESAQSEEELENRRSPRVKTTPLRRPSDVKAKPSPSTRDSDSDSEEIARTSPAKNTEEKGLSRAGDDSDSDEVPAVLLERAAMMQSSDEAQSDDETKVSEKVAKKCLFWLNKNSPMSPDKMCRKRKMLDRSPETNRSKRSVETRRECATDSSSDEQEPQKEIHHMTPLRSPRFVKREDQSGSKKEIKLRPRKAPMKSHQPGMESSSSSSEDEHEDDSGSDGDVQKIKPITDGLLLLGAAAFHQSSGDEEQLGPSGAADDDDDDDDPENRSDFQTAL